MFCFLTSRSDVFFLPFPHLPTAPSGWDPLATESLNQLPTGQATCQFPTAAASQLPTVSQHPLHWTLPEDEVFRHRFLSFWKTYPCLLKGYQLVHTCATMMGPPCVVLNHVSWCVEMEPPQTISQIEIPSHCKSFCGPFPNTFGVLGVPKHRASSKICPSRIEIPNWAAQVGCFLALKSTTQHWIICIYVFYLRLLHAVHTFDPLRPWQSCFFTVCFAAPAGQMRQRSHSQQGSQRPCHGGWW